MALSIVEQESASWTGTTAVSIPFTSAIQANDFIVIEIGGNQTSPTTFTCTDSSGTAYTNAATRYNTNATASAIYFSAAQVAAAAGTFSVSVKASAGSTGYINVQLIRGAATFAVDTPNVIQNGSAAAAWAANSTHAIGPYATSAAAFVALAMCAFTSATPTNDLALGSGSQMVADLVVPTGGAVREHIFGHQVTTGAVSAQDVSVVAQNAGATTAGWCIVPFLYTTSGGGNTMTLGATLGALACGATVGAALAAQVASGIGPNATAATTTAANAASIAATAGALAAAGTGAASQAMAASSWLSLTAALTAAQIQALATTADFGSLSSSLVVEAVGGINTAAVDSTLGALASSATITAVAGVNTAAIAATLGALSAAGTTNAQASIAGAGALALQSGVQFAASGTAALASAIGPLASALTLQPGAATLPVDARYFVAAPYRPFYAALAARSFYVMANPNITQRFDTKDPRETVVLTFDASADLDEGETLTGTPSVQVTSAFGTDPDPQNVVSEAQINGAPITANGVTIATGHAVQAIASGGLNQCGYLAAITCTTSNPEKVLTLKGILPVSSS